MELLDVSNKKIDEKQSVKVVINKNHIIQKLLTMVNNQV
jgi:hypothetical protein